MKRIIYKILYPLARLYWFIFRSKTQGVQIILQKDNLILLAKHTYMSGWALPGGGMKKNEEPEDAARREIHEELGLEISNFNKIGSFLSTAEHKKDTNHVFYALYPGNDMIFDASEIKEVSWFGGEQIPSELKSFSAESLKLWRDMSK